MAPECTLPRHVKCHECGGLGHLQKVCKKKCKAQLLEEVYRLDEMEHSHFWDKFVISLYLENQRVTFRSRLRSCGHFGERKMVEKSISAISYT